MKEILEGKVISGHRDAEDLAVKVLNFIVADLDRMIQFLNVTGLQPETIRESAKSPLFLLGVLDYVSKDEELLKALQQDLKIRPDAVLAASAQCALSPEEVRPSDLKPAVSRLPRRSLYS